MYCRQGSQLSRFSLSYYALFTIISRFEPLLVIRALVNPEKKDRDPDPDPSF